MFFGATVMELVIDELDAVLAFRLRAYTLGETDKPTDKARAKVAPKDKLFIIFASLSLLSLVSRTMLNVF